MTTPSLLRVLFVFLLSSSLFAAVARGQNRLDPIAPFLDEHTLAVGHVDLTKLDPAAAVKTLGKLAPKEDLEFAKRLGTIENELTGALQDFQRVGIDHVYLVVSLADVPKEPFFLVFPVSAGKDVETANKLLQGTLGGNWTKEAMHGSVVMGTPAILERLKGLKPAARPELAKAFERAGDSAAQLVFAPTEDTRRVLREMLPRLPDEVGGGSGKMLVDGLQWAVIAADPPPQLSLDLTVQSKDPDAAVALRGIIISSLQLAGKQEEIKREFPQFNDLAVLLTPHLNGDQLRLALNNKNGGAEQMLRFLARPVQAARVAAGRAQSVNNLKQLAIALHNYHDVHGHFPPAAIRSKDGKALLSWRVAILPYVEQAPQQEQFKLDEPWDSEHNKKLVETMPAVFASPSLTPEMAAKGLTSYVAPIAEKTVFADPAGTKISKITDGTSNTIALLEAHPKHAVIWSQPTDVAPDFARDPLAELRGQPNNGFNAALCDGSVRFIKADIDPKVFIWLLQMDDGNMANVP